MALVMSRKEKFAKKPKKKLWTRILVGFVLVLFGGFVGSHFYFQNHFKYVDVSGLTVAQATKKLNTSHIDEDGNYLVVRDSKINVNSKDVKKLFKHRSSMSAMTSAKLSAKSDVTNKQLNYRLKTLLPKFENRVDQINTGRKQTIDSKVILKNGKIVVQAGQQGSTLDKAKMVKDFKKQAKSSLLISVKMTKDAYVKPNSTQIAKQKKQLANILDNTVTLNTYNKTYKFVAKRWVANGYPTANGTYKFDSTKIKNWVAKFANKVDTLGKSVWITTHQGKRVRVHAGGTYGWKVNQSALTKNIMKNLGRSHSVTMNLKHYAVGTGYGVKGSGKTYVAIDLQRLHEYVYKNGKLMANIPIMSGTLTGGNRTPQGAFYIMYKQRHATLRGRNSDGSKYASPVSYWEPLTNSGVGMHDSPWQPASVYGNPSARAQYHSHGCLNNPPSRMGEVWKNTHTLEPVFIYY
ncbi:L,D-transpeptidase/peptidoglycan binding protein [Lentilactobacillus buchneri]|nr:L,D-transpeptidase/peptidoglycan binding protein [Lentilactobacillus sp. Egmn17]